MSDALREVVDVLVENCPEAHEEGHGEFPCASCRRLRDLRDALRGVQGVHASAIIDEGAIIGEGARIWHFCHVSAGAVVGEGSVLGQNVYVAPTARVGARCKVQNNVSLYDGVTLEDEVFVGPSAVFTNVYNPRAFVERKHEYRPTLVERGASIGANATIVCGVAIGRYAFVGAGAVVRRDVEPHAVVVGVPARKIGWICECGTTRWGVGSTATRVSDAYLAWLARGDDTERPAVADPSPAPQPCPICRWEPHEPGAPAHVGAPTVGVLAALGSETGLLAPNREAALDGVDFVIAQNGGPKSNPTGGPTHYLSIPLSCGTTRTYATRDDVPAEADPCNCGKVAHAHWFIRYTD